MHLAQRQQDNRDVQKPLLSGIHETREPKSTKIPGFDLVSPRCMFTSLKSHNAGS